jgi:bacillithiol system protein YtxJ
MHFFKNNTPQIHKKWHVLSDISDLDSATQASQDRPTVLFKHSTRCGISAHALERLEALEIKDHFDFYYLDILAHRAVSDAIAQQWGVTHQSPQVLIIKNGKLVFHTSHHAITPESILMHL